ncbi:MAG: metal-sulfur cluster assembly factor [Patescibacteria group bacterium]
MKLTARRIKDKLSEVMDPELNISIVDLGLIYQTKIIKNKIKIVMTLTTVGCPLIDMIQSEIISKMIELGFKKNNIVIEVTFDPPWTMERMNRRGKAMLGIN